MLLFLRGMTGFALTGDLFDMFVFFELMSVVAYALTGYKIEEPRSRAGRAELRRSSTRSARTCR